MLFQENYFHLHPDSLYTSLAGNNFYAFNEGIRIMVEHGISGLLFMLLYVGVVWKISVRSYPERSIAKAVLTGISVFAQFSYPLSNWQLSFVIVFFMADMASSASRVFRVKYPGWSPGIIGGGVMGGLLYVILNSYWQCWQRASEMVPTRFMPLYLQMKACEQTGNKEQAYSLAEQILAKKRKSDSPELYRILRETIKVHSAVRKGNSVEKI